MAQSKPILYSCYNSSCSWRVRIALHLKGIDYEYKAVSLLKDEHLRDNFLYLNPAGEVPVLVVPDGQVFTHSVAILEYLEELAPVPPLLPKDASTRAKVRALVDSIVAGIQPLQNTRVLKYIGEKRDSWAKYWVENGFETVERMLKKTHGKYCVGDTVTMADLCLVPQVLNALHFKLDMSKFPLINEISSRLSKLKEFKDSHPFRQPDCPDVLKA